MGSTSIKAILFDKDGTLLKFNETWQPVIEKSALEASDGDNALALKLMVAGGYDPQSKGFKAGSIIGAGNSEEIAELWSTTGARFSSSTLVEMLDLTFAKAMYSAVPIDGVADTIRLFHHHGYALGLASSDSEAAIRVFLQQLDVIPLFDFVVGYDSGFGHKPDAGMFEGFCKCINLDPRHVAMVGDNPQDMQMASAGSSGMRVGVLSGNSTAADLEPFADLILNHVAELPDFLFSRAVSEPMKLPDPD